jgi:hypothetical protein
MGEARGRDVGAAQGQQAARPLRRRPPPHDRKLWRAGIRSRHSYEKWIRAIRNLLVEQNVLARDEIKARVAQVRGKHEKAGRKVAKERVS